MIICQSLEYSTELAAQIGVSCVEVDFATALDSLITMQSVYDLLLAQWTIYGIILAFAWSKYAIKNHMKI